MSMLGGKSPSKIGLSIVNGIVSIGNMLLTGLLSPYKLAWSFIKKIFTTEMIQTILSTVGGMVVKVFNFITTPYKMAWEFIKSIFNSNVVSSILTTVGGLVVQVFNFITTPYKMAWSFIKNIFTVEMLQTVLSTVGGLTGKVFDLVTTPYKLAWKLIKSIFTVEMLSSILNTLTNAANGIFNLLTAPFKLGFDFIKSTFEFIKPIISEIGTIFGNVFTTAFSGVLKGLEIIWEKIKGIGGFIMDVVGKGISLVTNIVGGSTTEPTKTAAGETTKTPVGNELVDAIVGSNRLIVERLDKLTQLMSSGQIAVYIDGQKANQILAASSNKFGSLGQATTF